MWQMLRQACEISHRSERKKRKTKYDYQPNDRRAFHFPLKLVAKAIFSLKLQPNTKPWHCSVWLVDVSASSKNLEFETMTNNYFSSQIDTHLSTYQQLMPLMLCVNLTGDRWTRSFECEFYLGSSNRNPKCSHMRMRHFFSHFDKFIN